MRSILTILAALVLISCGKNASSDKNDLLTSSTWTIEKGSVDGEMPQLTETYKFLTDGTYLLEAGEVKVNGKWKWTTNREIYLQTEGLTANEQTDKFESSSNSYIKIIELTDKTLRTLERHETDTWESGFAKERSYTAKRL